ncbi:MAG: DUF2207 domain-containing protein [Firmicutes bacterium]|nr:DUF2207 domain-containing protein [Bacillota bacterium]
MGKSCENYKDILIDIIYEEKDFNKDIKDHLKHCDNCMKYYKELKDTKNRLNNLNTEPPIEYRKISKAFIKADEIKKKKSNIKSLFVFMLLSTIFLTMVVTLAVNGFSKEIIYFQISTYVIFPFILPFMIKKRAKKEGYDAK